jgi:hydroxymethylpyrimidine/phosphomethylpyrimidine kinase / thiaminase
MLFDADNSRVVVRALKHHYSQSSTKAGSTPRSLAPIICDPVCVSTSGHTLLHHSAIDVLITELFPISTLITPNTSEASLILSQRRLEPTRIDSLEAMLSATKSLMTLGSKAVLLKGGHVTVRMTDVDRLTSSLLGSSSSNNVRICKDGLLQENMEILQAHGGHGQDRCSMELVVDILMEKSDQVTIFVRPRIESTSTHGTGCTLSAAIAACMAMGKNC